MEREPNTDVLGQPFDSQTVEAVWQKARTLGTYTTLRVDAWGWTIVRQDYGNIRSRYGWEIDHIVPVSHGGGDELNNLQALQWENNRRKDQMESVVSAKRPAPHSHRTSHRTGSHPHPHPKKTH